MTKKQKKREIENECRYGNAKFTWFGEPHNTGKVIEHDWFIIAKTDMYVNIAALCRLDGIRVSHVKAKEAGVIELLGCWIQRKEHFENK